MVYHLERRRTVAPSRMQIRLLMFLAIGCFVFILWFTADVRAVQNREMYEKTLKGMREGDRENQALSEKMAERKKLAEQAKLPGAKAPPAAPGTHSEHKVDAPKSDKPEKFSPKAEVAKFLGESPVVIFSKSYCPYSKKAKQLLFTKYHIVPTPYVVELDEHEHMEEMQDYLEKLTKRRTVPNIMVWGVSIGGSDDLIELDEKGQLAAKIKSLGGKLITSVTKVGD